jgi:hypothetical protein
MKRTAMRFLVLILFSALVPSQTLAAQAMPLGAHRPWVELGLGGSSQDPNCAGCFQKPRIGGATASLSIGTTITQHFGIALLVHKFSEFSFEWSHDADYIVGLAQFSHEPGLTFNGGLGTGSQRGDDPPEGDNGSGTVIGGGIAWRLPSKSTFGLTLTADWMKSVSGSVRTKSGQQGSSYRPLLITLGLGLNLALSDGK